ncbi:MAG: Verru_Chthon cassette protein B [Chthoniobacteraceae bacterium]|nr:Verru_Chthon cassette protein B [Chthoniobacteraceae bacterium]
MDISRPTVRNFRPGKARAAFSLVEVVMAIGIVAFAFISVLGMIPTGLSTFRQAMNASVGSQIAQRVINDAQQMDFSMLVNMDTTGTGVLRFFDEQGNELTATGQGAVPAKAIYHARTVVTGSTVTPYSGSATSNPNLATVKVQVATNPGNQLINQDTATNLWADARFSILTFAALVSHNNSVQP